MNSIYAKHEALMQTRILVRVRMRKVNMKNLSLSSPQLDAESTRGSPL